MKITLKNLRQVVKEEIDKSILENKNPCWDGHSPGAQSGKKTKVGKSGNRVANCEKIKESDIEEQTVTDYQRDPYIFLSVDNPYDETELYTKQNMRESLSEGMLYHIDLGVGVDRNIFRPGSTEFFSLFREARKLYTEGLYMPKEDELELLQDMDIGEFAIYEGTLVPLDYPIKVGEEEQLEEAEYKGRKVQLNKPKRGSGGRAYVYVNSGKKDKKGRIKVRKVSFGSSMPDAMGKGEKARKRRKSFGARHNCSDKKDKTKPGYWSCRATKFFGRSISGWW